MMRVSSRQDAQPYSIYVQSQLNLAKAAYGQHTNTEDRTTTTTRRRQQQRRLRCLCLWQRRRCYTTPLTTSGWTYVVKKELKTPQKTRAADVYFLIYFQNFCVVSFLKRFNVCFLPKREEEDGEVTQINKNKLRSLTLAANLNTVSKQSEAPTPNTQRTIQSLRSRPFILSKWLIKIWEDNNKTEKKREQSKSWKWSCGSCWRSQPLQL